MWVLRGRADVNVAKAAEVKAAEVEAAEVGAAKVGATVISAAEAGEFEAIATAAEVTAAEVTAAEVTAAITTVGIASEATVVAASKASGGITSKLLIVVLHRDTWLFFDSFKGFVRIVVIEIREISFVVLSGMTATRCSGALCFDLSHLGVFGANGGHSSSKSKCCKGFHLSLEFFDSV